MGEHYLSIWLAETEADPCPVDGWSDRSSVLIVVPAREGVYPIDLTAATPRRVSFHDPVSAALEATEGVIQVERVTETQAAVGVVAEGYTDRIDGRFTVQICG